MVIKRISIPYQEIRLLYTLFPKGLKVYVWLWRFLNSSLKSGVHITSNVLELCTYIHEQSCCLNTKEAAKLIEPAPVTAFYFSSVLGLDC